MTAGTAFGPCGVVGSVLAQIREALKAKTDGGPWDFGGRSGRGHGGGHWGGGFVGSRGGWWPGPPAPPGPKAGRGDVRAAILALLREGPRNGYQIMSEIAERSRGAWRPSPG